MAQLMLLRHPNDARTKALRDIMSEVLTMDEPRRRFAAMMSGLDIHYDLGSEHPLIGRRMPDLEIATADGPVRVFTLLHGGHAVLINFGAADGLETLGWADRIRRIEAKHAAPWQLPALEEVAGPAAVLIRPDGYVAWVGDGSDAGLAHALSRWLGPATSRASL